MGSYKCAWQRTRLKALLSATPQEDARDKREAIRG